MLPLTKSKSFDLHNLNNVITVCHKETQSSVTNLKNECTITSIQHKDAPDTGPLKAFKLSEVAKDPREVAIVKNVSADEIHDNDDSSGSVVDDAIATRHKYCQEVIIPYLKDYPKDCPTSDDQLIRDALTSAQEDYPDYEPCFEYTDDTPEISVKKDISLSNLIDSNTSSVLSKDSEGSTCTKGKHVISDIATSHLSRNSTSINLILTNMDQKKEGCPEKVRPKGCPTKGKAGCPPPIESCKDESSWSPPGPPSACTPKDMESTSRCKDRVPSAGPCNDTPTPEKKKSSERRRCDMESSKQNFGTESDVSITPPKQKTTIEAHSEAIATIKTAVEDFFGKVYQTTKDAVTIIQTESAKHLGRVTAQKSASNTDVQPQRVHENKRSETITSFNFFRSPDNPDLSSQRQENREVDENFGPAGQVIGKIFAKVDSTMSMLSDNVDLQKVKSLLTVEDLTNRKSPFDVVKKTEEEEREPVSTSTIAQNSMFTAIKDRIVSMFSEGESEVKESVSRNSSSSEDSTRRKNP